ncbi:hypothetical protein HK57_00208 [Aspergillus ustus]|uniref:Cytochrome P450 n=1 Tax=Aspergillus ustus TaxID=40382 RepID=A0A0C1EFA2_ASPUT|nr:hypothetical protein HK57_00208 [Aspergillus ustus]
MAPVSFYDYSIGCYTKALNVLLRILKIASTHAEVNSFLETRLAPDMHPLLFQIRAATRHSVRLVVALNGKDSRTRNEAKDEAGIDWDALASSSEITFSDAIAHAEKTLAMLAHISREEVEAKADDIKLPMQVGPDSAGPDAFSNVPAIDYTMANGIPETFFHVFMTYAILRSKGVEIGKKDILIPFLPITILLLALGLFSFYHAVLWLLTTLRPPNYPPGPRPLPGLGNVHQMPSSHPCLKFDEWAKEYGPIVGLKLGPTNMVILNDATLVYEHIVKHGQHFSGRPSRFIAQNYILPETPGIYSLFMNDEYSRRLRTTTKNFLVGAGLFKFRPMQKAVGTQLVYKLFQSGDNWLEHIFEWGVSTPVAMMSGANVENFGKHWVHEYHASQGMFESLLDPGQSPPVDIFPVLRWVPFIFASWKRKAQVTRKALLSAYGVMMAHAKKGRHGPTSEFLIPKLLQQSADQETASEGRFTEQEITWLTGGMLDAGVDSSVVTFQTILLALATHPAVQRKAQAEIDAVFASSTGSTTSDSLPEIIDLERLPFLHACITEAIRWRPVSPLGLPRETTTDEIVAGYHIPAGTTIILNMWTIQMDSSFYDDPDAYKPERYMDDPFGANVKEGVSAHVGRKPLYTFGAGRRECPGKDLFFQNMRLAVAQILWAFNVVPDQKEELRTSVAEGFISSVAVRPRPFKIKFVPRREGFEKIMLEEKRKADAKLRDIFD